MKMNNCTRSIPSATESRSFMVGEWDGVVCHANVEKLFSRLSTSLTKSYRALAPNRAELWVKTLIRFVQSFEAVQKVSLSFRPQGEILFFVQISQSRSSPRSRRGSFEMTNMAYKTASVGPLGEQQSKRFPSPELKLSRRKPLTGEIPCDPAKRIASSLRRRGTKTRVGAGRKHLLTADKLSPPMVRRGRPARRAAEQKVSFT